MADSGIFNSSSISNRLTVDSDGGLLLRDMRAGFILEVRTKNNTYTIIPQASGDALIWGHPEYCPEPTLVTKLGSAHVTGLFRENYVGPGLRLTFRLDDRYVSTSRIVSIQAKPKN